jgi:hypothetical protein
MFHLSESGPVIQHRAFLLIVARGDIGSGGCIYPGNLESGCAGLYSTWM